MRTKRWIVQLKESERQQLREMTHKGYHNSRVLNRARVLLMADEDRYDKDIAQTVGVTEETVANIRRRYVQGGWRRLSMTDPIGAVHRNWMAIRRPIWWPPPAVRRRRGASGGP